MRSSISVTFSAARSRRCGGITRSCLLCPKAVSTLPKAVSSFALPPLLPPVCGQLIAIPSIDRSHRNTTDWPASEMGVPHICRLARYDFHLVNVFQFGLFPEDEPLTRHHHFLPPGDFEGRFNTFVVPLLDNLAARRRAERDAALAAADDPSAALDVDTSYPISAAPDLFVTTPTFWNLMRYPQELPLPEGEWTRNLGMWAPPTRERQDWWERRVQEVLVHVGKAWGGPKGTTKLVWRASRPSSVGRPPIRWWH